MTTPGPCPSEQQIAAFADGSLPPAEREAIGGHVDRCEACFDLLATLGVQAGQPLPAIDGALRDAALATGQRPPFVRRLLPAVSAAAAVIVAVVWWNSPRRPDVSGQSPASAVTAAPAPQDATRSSSGTGLVVVQEPHEGDAIQREQVVRWEGPREAASYEIQMTTAAGDVLFNRQVEGTQRELRLDVSPPPDVVCYLWVAAYLPEGRRVTSNVVKVTIRR